MSAGARHTLDVDGLPGAVGPGSRRAREHGTTAVEFALVAPLLFTLLFGILEVGFIATSQYMLSSASREGARYAMALGVDDGLAQYEDCDGIEAQARRMLTFATVVDATVTIDYLDEAGDGLTVCPAPEDVEQGHRVRVIVEVEYPGLVPLVPWGSLGLRAEHTRTIGGR